MATDAEIANDLDAQAAVALKKRLPETAQSLRRGAATIRRMMQQITDLQIRQIETERGRGTDRTAGELLDWIEALEAKVADLEAAAEAEARAFERYRCGEDR